MDIRMPEMDGIRALEEIRKIDPLISVIMLTGYGTLLTAQQAMLGGANQYLRKPPDVAELLDAVRKQTEATGVRRHQAKLAVEAHGAESGAEEGDRAHRTAGVARPRLRRAGARPQQPADGGDRVRHPAFRGGPGGGRARSRSSAPSCSSIRGMVEKAAEYCHHLSENWRSASKKMLELVRLDLVQIAREVQQVIFFGNVSIVLSGLAEAPMLGSKYELMRIFQNLFKNALEAGAKGVQVTFEREGAGIVATLIDDGPGMDAESVRRALQGGYTSKANGTGLGLGICRHLVTAHGGTFDLKSQAGRGTTVRLTFPAASQG